MAETFHRRALQGYVPPQSTVAGFVYTRRDPGTKVVSVSLLGDEQRKVFDFILFSPDLAADHRRVDFASLYGPGEVRDVDEAELREALERLPCCPTSADGSRQGDPLNFVLIGDSDAILAALVRAGWDETEILTFGSAAATARSFCSGRATAIRRSARCICSADLRMPPSRKPVGRSTSATISAYGLRRCATTAKPFGSVRSAAT
jgi:hypothetical protein